MIEREAWPRLPKDFGLVEERMPLDEYGPAVVLINRYYQHPVLFGFAANYSEPPAGRPTLRLSALLGPGAPHPSARRLPRGAAGSDASHHRTVVSPVHHATSRMIEGSLARPLHGGLERGLKATREEMQTSIKKIESASEALKA